MCQLSYRADSTLDVSIMGIGDFEIESKWFYDFIWIDETEAVIEVDAVLDLRILWLSLLLLLKPAILLKKT